MPRQRNYQAEYAARQARSQAKYGVSYNRQRSLIDQAKATKSGISAEQVRDALAALTRKGVKNPDRIVVKKLGWVETRRSEFRRGRRPALPPAYHDVESDEVAAPAAGRVYAVPDEGSLINDGDLIIGVRGRGGRDHGMLAPDDVIVVQVFVSDGEPVTLGQLLVLIASVDDYEIDSDIFSGPEWEYYRG